MKLLAMDLILPRDTVYHFNNEPCFRSLEYIGLVVYLLLVLLGGRILFDISKRINARIPYVYALVTSFILLQIVFRLISVISPIYIASFRLIPGDLLLVPRIGQCI